VSPVEGFEPFLGVGLHPPPPRPLHLDMSGTPGMITKKFSESISASDAGPAAECRWGEGSRMTTPDEQDRAERAVTGPVPVPRPDRMAHRTSTRRPGWPPGTPTGRTGRHSWIPKHAPPTGPRTRPPAGVS